MSTRTALLLTPYALFGTALLGIASPALAQDHRHGAAEHEAIEWTQDEVVQRTGDEAYTASVDASDAAEVRDSWANMERPSHPARRDDFYRRPVESRPEMYRSSAPRLAYSNEDREAWLADCRIVMRGDDYYEDNRYEDKDDNGGLLGGLLGAVVGGVAGNRIGGSGNRLAGTLIGAGVGGVAGAVIGSAIDSDHEDDGRYGRDADRGWAGEYCDAYLRRYEASGQVATVQTAHAQPVALMQAPPRHGAMREIVREEWVDVPVEEVARPTRQRAAPRRAAPERGKLTPVN